MTEQNIGKRRMHIPKEIQKNGMMKALYEKGEMNIRGVSEFVPFGRKTDYSRDAMASRIASELVKEGLVKNYFPNKNYRILSLTDKGKEYYKKMGNLN